ncbi:MAG: hypothetical protein NC191_05345 [Muribaculaceae bacterium]|nr:hypothetical protein [Muribaculaceae bacterium]
MDKKIVNNCDNTRVRKREPLVNIPVQKNKNNVPIFNADTVRNNNLKISHKTLLGQVMQEIIGKYENFQGKAPTFITGEGNERLQWCAYTTTYAIGKVSKMKGVKNPVENFNKVSEYINWAKGQNRYRPIKTQDVSPGNMTSARKARENEIRQQLGRMKEGDLIIWKSNYCAKTNIGGKAKIKEFKSSHIGMIEKVEGNYVYVIEGNANVAKSDRDFERYLNLTDSIVGNQSAGEIVELNLNDGVIRKKYSVEALAKYGYSGFINMNGISN